MVDSSFDLLVYIYSYDEDRITNVSTNFNINSDSTYDSQDRISIRKTLGTNCNIEEEFDYVTKSDNVTNLVNNHIVRINNEEVKINEYTYDDNGNIINVYNGYNTDYVYDKLGRLIRENNEELNKSITYKYDKAGNIIQKQTSDYTLENKLTNTLKDNYIYSGTSWKDKLIKFKDKTFEYDNLGRPVKIGEKTLTWNNKGKLSSYDNVTFDYDINGFRKSKTANGVLTKYYTFDNRIVREETNGSYITYIYNVDRLIGFCYNGISYIYERNILGDIIGIYNASTKEKVATYAYTGYGEHVVHNYTSNNIGNINPFRYRGYYYDVETQLYWVSSRYYSPELCRFISPDDVEYLDPSSINGLNLYVYCANDPINKYDPSGHFPWTMLFTPVGGVVLQVASSTLSYAGMAVASIFDKDIRNDMKAIGWNPFNKDENIVAKSNKVSFYRGVPVFRTSGSSVSFMCILLTKNGFKGSSGHYWTPEDILKHEWGHSIQQMTYGLIPYLVNIGIPSAFIDNSDDAPWEITADLLGGVDRNYNSDDIKQGWNYFSWGRLIGPFWWW